MVMTNNREANQKLKKRIFIFKYLNHLNMVLAVAN